MNKVQRLSKDYLNKIESSRVGFKRTRNGKSLIYLERTNLIY